MFIDTHAFEMAHGKKPSGFGAWAFFIEPDNNNSPAEKAFWVYQKKYSEALKLAVAEAKKRGANKITIGS
jgi:hypothetical protein